MQAELSKLDEVVLQYTQSIPDLKSQNKTAGEECKTLSAMRKKEATHFKEQQGHCVDLQDTFKGLKAHHAVQQTLVLEMESVQAASVMQIDQLTVKQRQDNKLQATQEKAIAELRNCFGVQQKAAGTKQEVHEEDAGAMADS